MNVAGAKSIVASLVLAASCAAAHAQVQRPKAEATPVLDADGARAGSSVRAALRVTLPTGLHVQSDKPREPSLIPTVLTIAAPAGIRVTEIAYPRATDLRQAGQAQPLAVFEETFAIGARLTIDAGAPAGDIVVPGRFRYQACDATSCYTPLTETVQWTVHIVAAAAPIRSTFTELFEQIRFAAAPAVPVRP